MPFALLCMLGCALGAARAVAEPIDSLQLRSEWQALLAGPTDSLQPRRFADRLAAYIMQEANWRTPIPRLEGVSDVIARGGALRLITWALGTPSREWVHSGLIVKPSREEGVLCIPLRDRRIPLRDGTIQEEWLTALGSADAWVGAVYFEARAFPYQRDTAYLLLGVAGSNAFVTRRVIETLYVSPRGEAQFGLPLIAQGQQRIGRIMVSHSARVGMEINFVEGKSQVLIDHLSPSSSQYTGMPAHYGPDFSYDALVLSRGVMWVYTMNVDPAAYSKRAKGNRAQIVRPASGDRRIGSYTPNWK